MRESQSASDRLQRERERRECAPRPKQTFSTQIQSNKSTNERFRERVERNIKRQKLKLQLDADMDANRKNKEYKKTFPVTELDLQVAEK